MKAKVQWYYDPADTVGSTEFMKNNAIFEGFSPQVVKNKILKICSRPFK